MPKITAAEALARLRILDLSRVRAGPTCVKQFADFGADVIKVESPPGVDPNESMGGPRHGPDMQNLHRNKRLNQAVKLSRTPARIAAATPELGQHTDEILRELAYSEGEIRDMRQRGIV